MNWSANGRARLYSTSGGPSGQTGFQSGDDQAHPASEAALDQDSVTGPDGVGDNRGEALRVGSEHPPLMGRHRLEQVPHQRAARIEQVGGPGNVRGEAFVLGRAEFAEFE